MTALQFVINKEGDITDSVLKENLSLASIRIQLAPAIRAAKSLNISTQVLSLHGSTPSELERLQTSEICLIGKMSVNSKELAQRMLIANKAAATRLRRQGSKIAIIYSDHMLEAPSEIKDFYLNIFKITDFAVFPSKNLFELSKQHLNANCKALLIKDPWQLKNLHPMKPLYLSQICKIVWFGSDANINYLIKSLRPMMEKSNNSRKFELTILGQELTLRLIKDYYEDPGHKFPNWNIRLVKWDIKNQPQQLEKEISQAHIAVIPSNQKDPKKSGVSHNRLVDAIRGGCVTIASPMDSYQDLAKTALLGDDMGELLKIALDNYNELCKKISESRPEILSKFSPQHNQAAWRKCFKMALNNEC